MNVCVAKNASNLKVIKGPVYAKLLRVIDGDTVLVKAYIWPSQTIETKVRIAGINAPELHAKCEEEKQKAVEAKKYLEKNLSKNLYLHNLKWGKYAGRVIATVTDDNDHNIFDEMIEKKMVVRYSGKSKRKSWCVKKTLRKTKSKNYKLSFSQN
jgi:endonuclease YncB( thermonuclease family)